jgi:hypothetical protein
VSVCVHMCLRGIEHEMLIMRSVECDVHVCVTVHESMCEFSLFVHVTDHALACFLDRSHVDVNLIFWCQ